MTQPTNKVCTKCHQEKPLSEFRWLRTLNRYQAQCKQCECEYSRRYQKELSTGTRQIYALNHRLNMLGAYKALEFINKQKDIIMTQLNTLQTNIQQWAVDRNLHTGNPARQTLKLVEELGELAHAIARNNREEIVDAIGDITFVALVLDKQVGYRTSFAEAVSQHIKSEANMADKETTQPQVFAELVRTIHNVSHNVAYQSHKQTDIYLVLSAVMDMADSLDVDYVAAVESAYNIVKDRKGKLVNGVFIKEDE